MFHDANMRINLKEIEKKLKNHLKNLKINISVHIFHSFI